MENGLHGLTAIGYSIEDYKRMFALSENELQMKILDCYSGANAFAVEMMEKNYSVIAIDPLYDLPIQKIKQEIGRAQQSLLAEVERYPERFVLDKAKIEEQVQIHQTGVERFLSDFSSGSKEGRYIGATLPYLPFEDEQFDLALVNHFLFTQSEKLTVEFHVKSIQELTRVANEVRIFPLVDHIGEISCYVGEVAAMLQMLGLGVEIRGVPFQFQKQDNAIMRIWNQSCSIMHRS